jgi:hypothetical protein
MNCWHCGHQSMKVHPVGVIGKRDVRINKLISKLYNRKEQSWVQ